jgi:hypothetical protein
VGGSLFFTVDFQRLEFFCRRIVAKFQIRTWQPSNNFGKSLPSSYLAASFFGLVYFLLVPHVETATFELGSQVLSLVAK